MTPSSYMHVYQKTASLHHWTECVVQCVMGFTQPVIEAAGAMLNLINQIKIFLLRM